MEQYLHLPQHYTGAPLEVSNYDTDISQINQVVHDTAALSSIYVDEQYYQPQQYDSVIYGLPLMSPPIDADQQSYIDLDLKPIISPEFENSQTHFSHEKSLENQHVCNNMTQEIDRPDLKLVIPGHSYIPNLQNNDSIEDVKLIFKSPLPSPPTSPPVPHSSKDNNTNVKPKKITSINAEDEDVKFIKQEEKDDNEDDQKQEDLPIFVNPKQYKRILKRRIAREKFEKKYNLSRVRKPYIHESRHKHAIRRPRGPGGRFLNANDMADMENNKRKDSLNSTSSICDSPTTPDSSSTFFGAQTTFPYISTNEHYQENLAMTAEGYLIENNDTYPAWEASPDLCKNNQEYFPSIMPTGNITYITNTYEENFSQQSPEQTEVYYVPTPITTHNLQAWNSYSLV